MSRPSAFAVVILVAVAGATSWVAWRQHQQLAAESPTVHRAAILESENASLRDALATAQQEATDAKNVVLREKIEQQTSKIRELPFKEPVVFDVLDKKSIRDVVAHKISEVYTDQEIANESTALSAFGLLPPNFPLRQTYIDLLGEQIGAFYDQHQHKLFMFRDSSLENAQNRVILSHELTHALQDQNFGLLKLPLEIKDNDDAAATASALVEGDATLEMTQYMAQDISWHTLTDTITYSATQQMDQIRKAPHYLREMLVFPYIQGQQFCAAAFARGGFPALSAVYANPPTSTAQILHPEEYFDTPRLNPIPINFPGAEFHGEQPLESNVLGEMGTRILFEQTRDAETADAVAACWRGDRYLVFDKGNVLVWKTEWNSPGGAAEAIAQLEAMCARRFKLTFSASSTGGFVSNPDPTHAHAVKIERPGPNQVVFILAPTQKSCDLLDQQFAGASHG